MVNLKTIVFAGCLVIAGIAAFFYFSPNEEKKVRKRFDLLSRYAEKKPGEDSLSGVKRAQEIGKLFAEACDFKLEGDPLYSFSGSYSRQEVAAYTLRVRSGFSDLSLHFHDLNIRFPERGLATSHLTARLTGKSLAGENVNKARELRFDLKQVEKEWLFSGLEVVEVLKR